MLWTWTPTPTVSNKIFCATFTSYPQRVLGVSWSWIFQLSLSRSLLTFFITVHDLFALDRYMDVYATSQKSRLCPHYKRNCIICTAPLHNLVARAFCSSQPEKPGSWSNGRSLYTLLWISITFTIIFVFFTIFTAMALPPRILDTIEGITLNMSQSPDPRI